MGHMALCIAATLFAPRTTLAAAATCLGDHTWRCGNSLGQRPALAPMRPAPLVPDGVYV